ncbi:MAG: hypothetical protein ACPHP7_10455 [Planctomycetota bacterium]
MEDNRNSDGDQSRGEEDSRRKERGRECKNKGCNNCGAFGFPTHSSFEFPSYFHFLRG